MANTFLYIAPSSAKEAITMQAGRRLVLNVSTLKAHNLAGLTTSLELDTNILGTSSSTLYFTKGLLTGYDSPGEWEVMDGKTAAKCMTGQCTIYTLTSSYTLKFINGFLVSSDENKVKTETYTGIKASGFATTYDLQWSHGLLTKADL